MFTSYFGSRILKKIDNSRLVSVSYSPPDYFKSFIRIYKPLCPSYNLVMNYKKGIITEYEYTTQYYSNILNKLDPRTIYDDLGKDSILLCYEKSGKFCHRRIIAGWLERALDVRIPELT